MNRKILVIFTFSVFLLGIMELIISGLLEMISTDLNMSYGLTGQLITVYAIAFAVFGPILIHLTEKFKPKHIIISALLLFLLGNLIFAISHSFLGLSIGRVVTAMAASVIIVKILDLTVVLSQPHMQGKMIALVYMGFSAANVFGIPISTVVGNMFGWRQVFVIIIILAIITAISIILFVPNKKTVTEGEASNKIINKKNVIIYITTTLLVLISNFIVLGYISPLLTENGFSIKQVSIALFIAGLGGMSGTYIGGILSDKFGPKKSILVMLSCFILSMIIMPFTYSVKMLFYLVFYLFSMFEWSTSPIIQAGLVNNVEGSAANVFSWNMSALNLGIGLGAIVGGIFIERINISFLPWTGIMIVLVAVILVSQLDKTKDIGSV